MKRAYQSSAIQSKPDLSKLVSEGFPTNGDPVNSVPPTQPGEGWFYLTTEELVSIVEEAKLVPDNVPQVVQALKIIIDNTLKACKYFVTVEGEGVQDIEQAKKFLAVIHGVAPTQSADLAADSTAVPTVQTIHDLAVLKTAAVAYTDKANTFTAAQLVKAALTVTLGTGTAFTVNGASALKGAVTVTGNTSITGTLGVTGKATLGEISASGAASFAKTITASGGVKGDLTGDVTGNVNGNATSADASDKLTTARKISITGDGTGSTTFDGSADRSITFTLDSTGVTAAAYGPAANATLKHSGTFTVPQVTVDAKGRVTAAATRTYTLPADSNTDTKVTQTVTTTNDDYPILTTALADATANRTEGVRFDTKVKINHSTGTVTAPKFNGPSTSCTGNAATATRLATARNIQVNLASTAAASFNGSQNVTPGVTGTLGVANGGTGRTDGKAAALATARTITLAGAVTGSASFDGSANVTIDTEAGAGGGGSVPTGSIIPYMGQGGVPEGYLLCNGATVSRTTYADLFAVIGTKFGSGNGSTTFTLPNGNGRYMQGTTGKPGSAISAGLPNITGSILGGGNLGQERSYFTGAFTRTGSGPSKTYGAEAGMENANNTASFQASRSNGLYGDSSSVTPSSYSVQYLIKY